MPPLPKLRRRTARNSLLCRFWKDQVDPAKVTEVGRDVFKYVVGRLGFDIDKLGRNNNIYV